MLRRTRRSTQAKTLFHYTTLFRSFSLVLCIPRFIWIYLIFWWYYVLKMIKSSSSSILYVTKHYSWIVAILPEQSFTEWWNPPRHYFWKTQQPLWDALFIPNHQLGVFLSFVAPSQLFWNVLLASNSKWAYIFQKKPKNSFSIWYVVFVLFFNVI